MVGIGVVLVVRAFVGMVLVLVGSIVGRDEGLKGIVVLLERVDVMSVGGVVVVRWLTN